MLKYPISPELQCLNVFFVLQAQEDEKQQASRREFSVLMDHRTTTTTEDHIKTASLRWPEDWIFHRGPYPDSQSEMTRRLGLPPRTIMHLIDTTSHLRQ